MEMQGYANQATLAIGMLPRMTGECALHQQILVNSFSHYAAELGICLLNREGIYRLYELALQQLDIGGIFSAEQRLTFLKTARQAVWDPVPHISEPELFLLYSFLDFGKELLGIDGAAVVRLARAVSGGKRPRGAKMPVAVMAAAAAASGAFSYRKLLEQCESQELEAPGGIATPPVYAQLLALYLLHNDMNNARYLWKRIPPAIKSANPELGAIWTVGQRIWQRDFPGIYTAIAAHQWSESIQPIMEALRDATRRRAFGLVSQAYTSICADDFAAFFVHLSVLSLIVLCLQLWFLGVLDQGWQADSSTRMVMPKKPGPLEPAFNRFHPLSEPAPVPPIPNEQQLARLTDYVAFLEN
ncbi:hypothetical protein JRQ81_000599 [Phrynocephalus forsythii]|uniref:COP9 signalosome complex subunit 8 n=1 Tax=Phrynocephalus forsythii TaxID=171643 RepID=A0A9Q0Y8C9_9SAUR|nr:hypothetical protein JRQ81_000599 [Phrynocephalus forsythii]